VRWGGVKGGRVDAMDDSIFLAGRCVADAIICCCGASFAWVGRFVFFNWGKRSGK